MPFIMKEILTKNLNTNQQEAVLFTEGPLIIFAGAGTGKTRVITHRIAYLLSIGVAPWSILAVTFTNKAAAEMKQRVIELSHETGEKVWISTFHAFCAYFLRVEAVKIGINPNFLIYDFGEQKNVIKDCLKELNIGIISRKKFTNIFQFFTPFSKYFFVGAVTAVPCRYLYLSLPI